MKRITLTPSGYWSAHNVGYLPLLDTHCDGILCSRVVGKDVFDTRHAAAMFAETRALGAVGELIHHYGDVFTFSVQSPPGRRANPDTSPPRPLPPFLTREYREGYAALRRARAARDK